MIPLLIGLVASLIGVVESIIKMAEHYGNYPGINAHTIVMLVVSIVGVIASLSARHIPKLSGVVMIICAILGFIFVTYSFLPTGVLLLLTGIIALCSSPEAGKRRMNA
ncbi:hypothetical protein AAC03nite_01330 [Alicyclobacillus acidoterrestris]|uniref:hypothetical protein n=1 Tax=Alicyclobacillus suci TaxID=2816080 RepID=UPI0011979C24|nr:hypothetical protein [Alicyclobacillus suci]GEO24348.1 hypothetical protein AAC03nite_01330 [Alicyclobacillus acidoterrestris]